MPNVPLEPLVIPVSEYQNRVEKLTGLLRDVNDKYDSLECRARESALAWGKEREELLKINSILSNIADEDTKKLRAAAKWCLVVMVFLFVLGTMVGAKYL